MGCLVEIASVTRATTVVPLPPLFSRYKCGGRAGLSRETRAKGSPSWRRLRFWVRIPPATPLSRGRTCKIGSTDSDAELEDT